jgi:hypothetical protein
MSEPPDLSVDRDLLEAAVLQDHEAGVAQSEAQVVEWTHARGPTNSPYRAGVFARERGTVYGKVVAGRPDDLRNVMVFGLDALGRSVIEREYGQTGTLFIETVVRYGSTHRTFVTYGQYGTWGLQYARVERWDGDRVLSVASMRAGVLAREDYIYDGDRVVEIVESRSEAMANGSYQQSWRVEYASDGKPAALISGSEVVWRRRAASAEFGRLLRMAEQTMTVALDRALDHTVVPTGLLVLLHQDDGSWSDQAFPELCVPSATEAAEEPRDWLPAEWERIPLDQDREQAVTQALRELDESGLPRGDEAATFLRVVAHRVSGLARSTRGAELRIVVTTHDPRSIDDDVRRAG